MLLRRSVTNFWCVLEPIPPPPLIAATKRPMSFSQPPRTTLGSAWIAATRTVMAVMLRAYLYLLLSCNGHSKDTVRCHQPARRLWSHSMFISSAHPTLTLPSMPPIP